MQKAQKEYEIKEIEAEQTLDNIKVNMKKVYYQLQALEKKFGSKRELLWKKLKKYMNLNRRDTTII